MADNTINYKIKIDTSSLADQLSQIRSQIDAAVSNASFAATNTGQGIANSMSMAQQQAMSFMNSTRLGMSKMMQDISSMGANQGQGPQSFYTMGNTRLGWEAATAFSHDPRMPMTPGMYQREAMHAFGDRAIMTTLNAIDFGAGAGLFGGMAANALGMTGTASVLGAVGGAFMPISLGAGAFMATMGADVTPSLRARAFARDSSWRFLSGKFSGDTAGQIGVDIAQAGRLGGAVGYEVSQNDAMGMVQEFAGMGGFDSVRTANEFRDRVKILVENTRKYVQVLGTTQQEAMSMMKDIMNMGLAPNSAAAGSMAIGIAAQAYQAGYTPTQFSAFGMQSMEMMRGTGVGMGAAYLGGLNTLATTRGMMQAGAMSPGLVAEYGGDMAAATRMNQLGYNYGFGEGGLTWMAARNFYGQNPTGLFSQYSGAVTGLNSINKFMGFAGGLPRSIGQIGAGNLAAAQAGQFLNEFKMLQGGYSDLEFNEDTFSYYMGQRDPSMSAADRSMMFSIIRSAKMGGAAAAAGEYIGNRERVSLDARPGSISVMKDLAGNALASMLQTEQVAKLGTGLAGVFDEAMLGIQRAGERGDLLGGLLQGVTAGNQNPLSAFVYSRGYDRRDLSKATFNSSVVTEGLRQLTGKKSGYTDEQKFADAASEALGLDPDKMVATQYALRAVGIGQYTDRDDLKTPAERLSQANKDYSALESAASSGNAKAKAIINSTTRGQYISATNPTYGEGSGVVRQLLTTAAKGSTHSTNAAKRYDEVVRQLNTRVEGMSVANSDYSADTQFQASDFKFFTKGATSEDSWALKMISDYNALGEGGYYSQSYQEAIGGHMTKERAYHYAREKVAFAKRAATENSMNLAELATLRISGTAAGKDLVKLSLEKAGIDTSKFNFETEGGIQQALLAAPEKLRDQLIKAAGNVEAIAYDAMGKPQIKDPQLAFHVNALGIQSEISKTLSTMGNVDLSTASSNQVMAATTDLMVTELRKFTAAIGTAGSGPALRVYVTTDDWTPSSQNQTK